MKHMSRGRTVLVAIATGFALLSGTVTATAEPMEVTATEYGQSSAFATPAGSDDSTAVITEWRAVIEAQSGSTVGDMRPTALPAMLVWAIFRALVQKFGPVIAKEILCAQYGICW